MDSEIRHFTSAASRYELRDVPRVALDLPVFLHRRSGDALVGRTRDVSVSGVCVETPVLFEIEEITELTLELATKPLRLPVDGAWQRSRDNGSEVLSGLAFRRASEDPAAALLQLVDETTQTVAAFLSKVPATSELDAPDLITLVRATRYRNATVGASIQRAGTSDPERDAIYVVAYGEVSLSLKNASGRAVRHRTLGPGELFGGLALVGEIPVLESAEADTDVRLLEIDADAWHFLVDSHPGLAQHLGFRVLQAACASLTSEPNLL